MATALVMPPVMAPTATGTSAWMTVRESIGAESYERQGVSGRGTIDREREGAKARSAKGRMVGGTKQHGARGQSVNGAPTTFSQTRGRAGTKAPAPTPSLFAALRLRVPTQSIPTEIIDHRLTHQ